MNYRPEKIELGDFFEDCRYHPCECVDVDPTDKTHVNGKSLVNGVESWCSLGHCGLVLLTEEEAELLIKRWNEEKGFTDNREREAEEWFKAQEG